MGSRGHYSYIYNINKSTVFSVLRCINFLIFSTLGYILISFIPFKDVNINIPGYLTIEACRKKITYSTNKIIVSESPVLSWSRNSASLQTGELNA